MPSPVPLPLDRIPALTLMRPWTTCVFRHGKNVENRGWRTSYRGPVYIHAGKAFDEGASIFAADLGIYVDPANTNHARGVVGVATLTDICDGRNGDACTCGPWAIPGQCHWQLTNVSAFPESVVCGGARGLWWPHHVLNGDVLTVLEQARETCNV